MMQYAPIIYCRTYSDQSDYRSFLIPELNFCPKAQSNEFTQFIRQVINTDNPLYGNITEMRWTFYRSENFILWGAGFENHLLKEISPDYYYDFQGRKIRTFAGVVINVQKGVENLKLPYATAFIVDLFRQYVVGRWEEPVADIQYAQSEKIRNFGKENIFYLSDLKLKLNTEQYNTKVFPSHPEPEYIKRLFFEAIKCNKQKINVVIGLNNRGHAIQSGFMNAVCLDVEEPQIFEQRKGERTLYQLEKETPKIKSRYDVSPTTTSRSNSGKRVNKKEEPKKKWLCDAIRDFLTGKDHREIKNSPHGNFQKNMQAERSDIEREYFHDRLVEDKEPILESENELPPLVHSSKEIELSVDHPKSTKKRVVAQLNEIKKMIKEERLSEDQLYEIRSYLEKYLID